MNLFDALFNRRSIRQYTNKHVSDELLKEIIKAGMHAPSAVNKQPWHFIMFRNKESVKQILAAHPSAKMLGQASAGILICFDKQLQHDEGYGPVDCSAATQNMLLAAHGLELAACWIGIYPRENRIQALHKLFKLPEHVIPFAVVSVGYSNEQRSRPSRFKAERIHKEKWNS